VVITGVLHAGLLVADTVRSLEFYRDVLGMHLDDSRPDLGYPGAWLWAGRQQIHLMQLPNPDPSTGRPIHGGRDRHIALAVNDVERVHQRLLVAGISCSLSKSGRRAVFCRDPDGNALEFVEQIINNKL